MIKILLLILFTCVAVFVGPMLADTQGFVHIVFGDRIIETSVNTAIVIYVLSILLLFVLYIILKKILNIPSRIKEGFKNRAFNKKLSAQDEAFIDFSQGQFEQSLGLLKHSSSLKKMSEKSLLVAAQSAFALELYDFTRKALDEAQSRGRQAKLAADILRAKLNLDIGNSKAALEYLDGMNGAIKNKYICQLYLKCYLSTEDYKKILDNSKEFIKQKALTKEQVREYYIKYIEKEIREADSKEKLEEIYRELSREDKRNSRIMGAIIYKFLKYGNVEKANSLALDLMKEELDPAFVESIASWEVAVPDVLIFLKKYASKNVISTQVNLPLLKAMGNLEFRAGLMTDALDDYKKALAIEPSTDIYIRIGTILTNLEKVKEATDFFRKANALIYEDKALTLKK
ncbi:heme biosynthesis-associated TPR protein [Succinivibrio dextrinosolvens]|uniref:heme biosynthesis HemY N-terminal domain-containing protein n=1 Tax=Succinivibrio dextrinosolvens TaxID=83771 RepID=UPI0008E78DF8|nr:heme biosynthesis HemY N-terminal domain-containing protein [Succinivibrio dextrinosolvens]SFS48363.1 heme biosynthesis-associated TPR protein [Succinivibrio dextrinosolvens]